MTLTRFFTNLYYFGLDTCELIAVNYQWLWRLFVTVIPAQNFVGRDLFDGVDFKQCIH